MNLLDIKGSPLSNDDMEALLRILLEAQSRGVGVSIEYFPHFIRDDLRWQLSLSYIERPLIAEAPTLEQSVEIIFMKLREKDRSERIWKNINKRISELRNNCI